MGPSPGAECGVFPVPPTMRKEDASGSPAWNSRVQEGIHLRGPPPPAHDQWSPNSMQFLKNQHLLQLYPIRGLSGNIYTSPILCWNLPQRSSYLSLETHWWSWLCQQLCSGAPALPPRTPYYHHPWESKLKRCQLPSCGY